MNEKVFPVSQFPIPVAELGKDEKRRQEDVPGEEAGGRWVTDPDYPIVYFVKNGSGG
jgi:hypothetical protein